ncbi:hypothetical protein CVD25_01165 [Bacillus canaveralius]|uniref:Uncharacterized protein n=1 Tax=Bacillus canaveralius TaxID=1403243 RepID=A0A2N5GPN8_9BACI|nr:hypothetical protein [Bacillus canaveralius]PLR84674.1 hypothetical protein CU635_06275 [Bacillus canaveralius]PLS00826.1 hypothetical protein CVD25_01165 [Bacillus canaveralius]
MDPFIFGIVFTGATGGVLLAIHALGESGVPINDDMIKLFMELVKSGTILWFFNHIFKLFF